MNAVIRAKIKIDNVQKRRNTLDITEGEQIIASAVYSSDKTTENYSFSSAAPSLNLQMYISNPGAFNELVQGKEYYLDFIPVEDRTVGPANEEARQQFIAAQTHTPDEPKRCIHGEYTTRCPLHGGRP